MKIFIISGEASGDLHGGNLAKELFRQSPDLSAMGWGGEHMENAGVEVVKHYKELAFMGFVEVLANLRTISGNFKLCKNQISDFQPDAVVLIDYPGFNLRMAKFIKSLNIPVFYYISPQIWAWKESRVKTIKRYVNKMFVILPFEKSFYQKHDYTVEFVGHPLLDALERENTTLEEFQSTNQLDQRPVIAMIPGSRKQEISRMLSVMHSVVGDFPEYQFIIAGVSNMDENIYEKFAPGVKVVFGQTYDLFKVAQAGMVTSGTATLEAAIHNMPEVVCYKGSLLSYWIARALIKVKYISLVNLIMDKEVVKELIQSELSTANLSHQLRLLVEEGTRKKLLDDYELLYEKLGGKGASERTATAMLKNLKRRN